MNELAKDAGREALSQLAQHNKTAFQLNKAFALKDAVVSTAQGVSKALGMGPVGIPLAIAIGALGAVQIASIMSQKYQGKRLGGRMNQDQPYMVGEAGPELVVPDRASNVVPNGQLGNMGKQVNVNFQITTVDATGFSELLVNSRATIVNVINQALNEKGKEVLV
jgi:SLT domain-containing protein